jgi:type IV pilus assembly protein PilA
MKKSQKGFTLIELLVVVAIIGILAAVGVVAYSGYTTGAKKSATKSNQANIVKYVSAELKKCDLGESFVMRQDLSATATATNSLDCGLRKTSSNVSTKTFDAIAKEFKNPWNTGQTNGSVITGMIKVAMAACDTTTEGQTSITDTGDIVTVTSCPEAGDALITNTFAIE